MAKMDEKYGKIVRIKRAAYDMLDDIRDGILKETGLQKISDSDMLSLAVCALYTKKEEENDTENDKTSLEGSGADSADTE